MMARISDPVFAPWKLGKVWIRILTRTRNALLMHRCQRRTTPLIDGASLFLVFHDTDASAFAPVCQFLQIFRPNVNGRSEKYAVEIVVKCESNSGSNPLNFHFLIFSVYHSVSIYFFFSRLAINLLKK